MDPLCGLRKLVTMTSTDDAATPARRLRASDTDRDAVLSVLTEAHSAGRLDVEEVDERQTEVLGAKFVDELLPAIDDLPEGAEVEHLLRTQISRYTGGPGPVAPPPVPRTHGVVARADDTAELEYTVLGGHDITLSAGTTSVNRFTFLGGDNIDLTRALGPEVEITVSGTTILGGHNILVPLGVRVIDTSGAILGGNNIARTAQGDGSNGTLVLRGTTILGGHNVKLARGEKKKLRARRED